MKEMNYLKPLDWECVGEHTKRLKIHGGWLVLYTYVQHPAITFVPDANHEWVNEKY
jgi:hypothetical protein